MSQQSITIYVRFILELNISSSLQAHFISITFSCPKTDSAVTSLWQIRSWFRVKYMSCQKNSSNINVITTDIKSNLGSSDFPYTSLPTLTAYILSSKRYVHICTDPKEPSPKKVNNKQLLHYFTIDKSKRVCCSNILYLELLFFWNHDQIWFLSTREILNLYSSHGIPMLQRIEFHQMIFFWPSSRKQMITIKNLTLKRKIKRLL
jgi:hypothetical protein